MCVRTRPTKTQDRKKEKKFLFLEFIPPSRRSVEAKLEKKRKEERVQCTAIASCATWGETIAPEGAGRDLLVGRRPPNRSSTPVSWLRLSPQFLLKKRRRWLDSPVTHNCVHSPPARSHPLGGFFFRNGK
jgi:hypothetical protein